MQSFEPWIQNRCFEYVIDKYAKDKLLKLITTNGKPDARKIQRSVHKHIYTNIYDHKNTEKLHIYPFTIFIHFPIITIAYYIF